jgi:hypothetical protein
MSTQTYDRNLRAPRAYLSTAVIGRGGHRPVTVLYYGDAAENELVRMEERLDLGGSQINMWGQTISGSNYTFQWPDYDHYVVYNPWEETTYSGTVYDNVVSGTVL